MNHWIFRMCTALSVSITLFLVNVLPARSNADSFTVSELSRIVTGDGEGGAEIPTYHSGSKRLFATNGARNAVDIYGLNDPSKPVKFKQVDLKPYGTDVTSVAAGRDVVVAAVHRSETFASNGTPTTPTGILVVMNTNGEVLSTPDLGGVLPDAVTFTPSGNTALVAIEGQPVCAKDDPATPANESTDYTKALDPLGGVSIVDLSTPSKPNVKFVSLKNFSVAELRTKGLALSSVVNDAGKDLEPEYIVALDESRAYVTIQEANGLGVLDVERGTWIEVRKAFESKLSIIPMDTSDRDAGDGPRSLTIYRNGIPIRDSGKLLEDV